MTAQHDTDVTDVDETEKVTDESVDEADDAIENDDAATESETQSEPRDDDPPDGLALLQPAPVAARRVCDRELVAREVTARAHGCGRRMEVLELALVLAAQLALLP